MKQISKSGFASKKKTSRRLPWPVVGVVVVLGGVWVLYNLASPSHFGVPQTSGDVSPTSSSVLLAGQSGLVNGQQVTLIRAIAAPSIPTQDGAKSAPDGDEFIIVEFAAKNVSEAPMALAAISRPQMLDSKGVAHQADVDASALARSVLGISLPATFGPGATVQDAEVFVVDASKYDPRTWYVQFNQTVTYELSTGRARRPEANPFATQGYAPGPAADDGSSATSNANGQSDNGDGTAPSAEPAISPAAVEIQSERTMPPLLGPDGNPIPDGADIPPSNLMLQPGNVSPSGPSSAPPDDSQAQPSIDPPPSADASAQTDN